jgi:hypothetical protein
MSVWDWTTSKVGWRCWDEDEDGIGLRSGWEVAV